MRMLKLLVALLAALLPIVPSITAQDTWHERAQVTGPVYEGVEVSIDLPDHQHVKNFGAPADQKGLCVFASMDMAARWHNIRQLVGVVQKVREGGGWPEKVDQVIASIDPNIKYEQYEGADPAFLERGIRSGAPVCVTYGYGERYGMQTIAHMVLLVHIDSRYAAIVDNNFPGNWEWMSRDEFLRRWVHPSGKGWAYYFLHSPPPPPPRNVK